MNLRIRSARPKPEFGDWNMHAMITAATGAFKDAAAGMEGQTIAAISKRNDFEHLEARGREVIRRNRRGKARKQTER